MITPKNAWKNRKPEKKSTKKWKVEKKWKEKIKK